MQKNAHFILFDNVDEFGEWLKHQKITRKINYLQVHHTWEPSYDNFKGNNHFQMLDSMRNFHMRSRGFDDIAQQLSTFPDGKIAYSLGRPFDKVPAGIRGANSIGICVENIGNFDSGGDKISVAQKKCIIKLYAIMAKKFKLPVSTEHIVYHHWWSAGGKKVYDLKTGKYLSGSPSKSCPGNNFFGGNKVEDAKQNFIPLIQRELDLINNNGKLEVVKSVMKSISKYFNDVDAKWAVDYIDRGKERGIFTVPEDKNFHPTESITRQEVAVVIDKAIEYVLNQLK